MGREAAGGGASLLPGLPRGFDSFRSGSEHRGRCVAHVYRVAIRGLRRAAVPRPLVHRGSTIETISELLDGPADARCTDKGALSKTAEKAQPRDTCGRSSNSRTLVEGRAPLHQRSAAHRARSRTWQPASSAKSSTHRPQEYASIIPREPAVRSPPIAPRGSRFVHVARKVVGVGSVGTRAWIVLLPGRRRTDPLFLQFKEAQASVLEAFAAMRASSRTAASGSSKDSA